MDIQVYEWGADVYCANEPCAKLAHVVLDPEEATVTDLIVEQGLLMMKKAWVVPLQRVQQAGPDGIWLTLTEEELRASQPYKRRVIEEVAAGYGDPSAGASPTNLGVPDTGALPTVKQVVHDGVASSALRVVGKGIEVRDLVEDKSLGSLKQIVVDVEQGKIKRMAVSGGLFGEDFELPASAIVRYDEDRFVVQEASKASNEVEPLAQPERNEVSADDRSDLPLYARIERAFHDDPRTQDEVVDVLEQQGVVTLTGEVQSVEASRAAEEIASKQSGVITVHNNLKVRG